MPHYTTISRNILTTAGLSITALALARQNSPAGQVTVPVHTDADLVFGNFRVGDSRYLSLIIGTDPYLTFLNHGVHGKTQKSTTDGNMIDASENFLLGRQCATSELNWMLYTDVMTVRGPQAHHQQLAYLLQNGTIISGTMFGIAHDGILGLSGGSADGLSPTQANWRGSPGIYPFMPWIMIVITTIATQSPRWVRLPT
jgi:hypothetical protein